MSNQNQRTEVITREFRLPSLDEIVAQIPQTKPLLKEIVSNSKGYFGIHDVQELREIVNFFEIPHSSILVPHCMNEYWVAVAFPLDRLFHVDYRSDEWPFSSKELYSELGLHVETPERFVPDAEVDLMVTPYTQLSYPQVIASNVRRGGYVITNERGTAEILSGYPKDFTLRAVVSKKMDPDSRDPQLNNWFTRGKITFDMENPLDYLTDHHKEEEFEKSPFYEKAKELVQQVGGSEIQGNVLEQYRFWLHRAFLAEIRKEGEFRLNDTVPLGIDIGDKSYYFERHYLKKKFVGFSPTFVFERTGKYIL